MTLKGHYALYLKTRASFGAHREKLNEDILYCQRRRCSPVTVDSDNVRFMRIFAGVPWKGGVIPQWDNRKRVVFSLSFSLHIRHLRKWDQHYYIVLSSPLSPFHWHQNTWPWMTSNGLKGFLRYMFTITNGHWLIICYLFTVVCLLHVWPKHVTNGEVREAEYSKQWSAERQNIWKVRKICGSSVDAIYRRNLNK